MGDNQNTAGRYVALDSLRGVAALGVVFLHIQVFGVIASLALFREARLFVDFFFVLSGFVIAAAYGERIANGFSRGTFLFLRLGRVYPLHFAIVLVYLLMEFTFVRPVLGESHSVWMALRAILLLDGYFGLGNFYNGVSWSISVELFMYTAAALLFGTRRVGLFIAGALFVAAALALYLSIDLPIFTSLLQRGIVGFGTGVACYSIYKRLGAIKGRLPATIAEAAVLLAAGATMVLAGPTDYAVLACVPMFAAVVVVFAGDAGLVSRGLASAPFVALGLWSYSVYMVHMFVIAAASRAFAVLATWSGRTDLLRRSDDLDGLRRIVLDPWAETAVSIAVCLLVIAVSAITYRLIEEPGRRWAKQRAKAAGARRAELVAPTI